MKLVVTTGATVTFRRLLARVLDPQFLRELELAGFTDIVVQYGAETRNGVDVSAQYVLTLGEMPPLVTLVGLTNDVPALLKGADVVVTHAGTGSILDAVRLGYSVVVVPNPELMDNHQQEIATAFAGLGVCEAVDVTELQVLHLVQAARTQYKQLPPPQLIESVLAYELQAGAR